MKVRAEKTITVRVGQLQPEDRALGTIRGRAARVKSVAGEDARIAVVWYTQQGLDRLYLQAYYDLGDRITVVREEEILRRDPEPDEIGPWTPTAAWEEPARP